MQGTFGGYTEEKKSQEIVEIMLQFIQLPARTTTIVQKAVELVQQFLLLASLDYKKNTSFGNPNSPLEEEDTGIQMTLPEKKERRREENIKSEKDLLKQMKFGKNLSLEEKAQMADVIFKYKEVLGSMVPGGAKASVHSIDLLHDTPARTRYQWSEQEKNRKANQWLLDHVQEWLEEGLIEETIGGRHYTMATAPAKKDDEGKLTQFRLCVDYRALNKITRNDP